MSGEPIPDFERELLASMRQYVEAAEEVARRERHVKARLRRRDLRLTRQRAGYCITERETSLCEAFGLSLEEAEAWAAENIPDRRRFT